MFPSSRNWQVLSGCSLSFTALAGLNRRMNCTKTVVIPQGTKVNMIAVTTLSKSNWTLYGQLVGNDTHLGELKNALEDSRPPPYMYLEAALEKYWCPCPVLTWDYGCSIPLLPLIPTSMPSKAAPQQEQWQLKCKTNLCTLPAWLNVPQISHPVLSPLRVISLQNLLLLLSFFPITISQQKAPTYQPVFLREIPKSSQLVSPA